MGSRRWLRIRNGKEGEQGSHDKSTGKQHRNPWSRGKVRCKIARLLTHRSHTGTRGRCPAAVLQKRSPPSGPLWATGSARPRVPPWRVFTCPSPSLPQRRSPAPEKVWPRANTVAVKMAAPAGYFRPSSPSDRFPSFGWARRAGRRRRRQAGAF